MDSHALLVPAVRTFLNGFQCTAESRPDAPAVTQGGMTLTYRQLDHRSNALARHLRGLGIGPEMLVGLLLDRSPDMIVALLGILKAGAAYVPLDPTFPADRLSFMVEDSRPAAVVAQTSLLSKLPSQIRTVCLDRDAAAIDAESVDSVDLDVEPWTRAYVIYTSGSTGVPKGVEITHGAVMNLLESFRVRPGLQPNDVVLAHTTLSFDIAVIELWLPLLVGARIVLAPAGRTDARAIADLVSNSRVTFLQATPSLWRLLLQAGWRNGGGLTALSGGEPLSRDLADALLATGADAWNVYGPTETTVWSSLWHVSPTGPVFIGEPIRDTELLILDDALRPVGGEAIGELCIGGAGLARGYLNAPALTAERFIPHPLAPTTGARIYRTGDLARRRGESGVECLGRLDNQIKVDGFRIEPAEIEAVLASHPSVRQAIVRAIDRAEGDRRLAAYIDHGSDPAPAADELRSLARAHLPPYMVPSAFVMLNEIPLTPNGKIDRSALPTPTWDIARVERTRRALRTPLEHRLAGMWHDILGIDDVGADDNFFDVGGRSRLGAQLFARIETELGVRLPLAVLFESPTIAALASAIAQGGAPAALWRCLVPIQTRGSGAPLFCIHPIGGNVLAYRDLAKRLAPRVSCYGLQAVGLDGTTPPLTSIESMASRYIDEIQTLQPHGPYHLCGFSFGGLVAFEVARQLAKRQESVGLLAMLDTAFPDLASSRAMNWLAGSSSLGLKAYRLIQRARRHGRSMRRMGPRGYLAAIAGGRAVHSPQPAADPNVDNSVLLADHVRRVNVRATIDYVPGRYDGLITYFRAYQPGAPRDRRDLWTRMARSVEFVDVEGSHSDIRVEPRVHVVAREVLKRLGRQA